MDCLHDFDEELRWVFTAGRERMESYPPAFQKDALKYLERYNVFEESGAKNYSCFLLPFWLGKTFPLAPEVCRRISLA
ncbi:MAG TPA: hypothetical protein VHY08_23220, partial [Bacillota bacterium]|nr:hypothetical protein [Bacillota bacterium]